MQFINNHIGLDLFSLTILRIKIHIRNNIIMFV